MEALIENNDEIKQRMISIYLSNTLIPSNGHLNKENYKFDCKNYSDTFEIFRTNDRDEISAILTKKRMASKLMSLINKNRLSQA